MKLINAVSEGDFILTVTGGKNVIKREHFEKMKDGVILANAGHFNIEYDKENNVFFIMFENTPSIGILEVKPWEFSKHQK